MSEYRRSTSPGVGTQTIKDTEGGVISFQGIRSRDALWCAQKRAHPCYDLIYDADNRLVEVEKNQTAVGEYVYDGDGNRVKSVVNGVTTLYIGNYYEWRVETSGSTGVNYYYAGSQRVAMRVGAALSYLFGDDLTL